MTLKGYHLLSYCRAQGVGLLQALLLGLLRGGPRTLVSTWAIDASRSSSEAKWVVSRHHMLHPPRYLAASDITVHSQVHDKRPVD